MKYINDLKINSIYEFDDALSINEILCKFWEKIEEVINVTNEIVDILNWINEEGTLDSIINTNELNAKVDTFQVNVNNELDSKN